jgi:hypothetical protein
MIQPFTLIPIIEKHKTQHIDALAFAKKLNEVIVALNAALNKNNRPIANLQKPHRVVCQHCYGHKNQCSLCINGSRFQLLRKVG